MNLLRGWTNAVKASDNQGVVAIGFPKWSRKTSVIVFVVLYRGSLEFLSKNMVKELMKYTLRKDVWIFSNFQIKDNILKFFFAMSDTSKSTVLLQKLLIIWKLILKLLFSSTLPNFVFELLICFRYY